MKTVQSQTLIFALTTAAVIAVAPYAGPRYADRGQIEFLLNCADCHGTDA
jgi:mono/diheme cytochrome c family protein